MPQEHKLSAARSLRLPPRLAPSLLLLLASSLFGCEPDVDQSPPTPGPRACFDPATGQIPIPSDLLRDPLSGRISVPLSPGDSQLTQDIKASINRLDGWGASQTIQLPLDAPIAYDSLSPASVFLFDVTDTPTRLDPASYAVLYNFGPTARSAPPYWVTIKLKPTAAGAIPEFKQGHRYLAAISDQAKDLSGQPLIGAPALELLKSSTPLVDSSGRSQVVVNDSTAQSLEFIRSRFYAPAFQVLRTGQALQRASAKAYTVFSIQSSSRPAFNPTPFGTKLPSPCDQLLGASLMPANAPLNAPIRIQFDLPLQPESIPAAVRLVHYSAADKPKKSFKVAAASAPDSNGLWTLDILPDSPFEPNSTYLVALTSELKGLSHLPAQPSTYSSLLAHAVPLVDMSKSPPALNSPYLDSSLDVLLLLQIDPQAAQPSDWDAAYAMLGQTLASLETLRGLYAPYYDFFASNQDTRDQIVALWTFTTAAQ